LAISTLGAVTDAMQLTVSEVARPAHVTVQTLHPYDEIGLLVSSARSAKGYRPK
jgi:DNA-binding transcriptional MerR regulator